MIDRQDLCMIEIRPNEAAVHGHHGLSARPDVVVVANRLPVTFCPSGPRPSPGGLVSALTSVVADRSHWIGWAGPSSGPLESFASDGLMLHPVPLGDTEVSDYYDGFCNSVLWPLFHGRLQPPDFNRSWWDAYVAVNERFAKTVAAQAPLGGCVWVHDYHLLLIPELLRAARPDLRIGIFLHIPFPAPQIFDILPWRSEIITGMMSADLVGFQTANDASNFRAAADRNTRRCARTGGRNATIGVFPISVDFTRWNALGSSMAAEAARKRRQLNAASVLLGVDRLDYTKGIAQRIEAFGELLDEGHLSPDGCVFVQIAVPSRTSVDAYCEERAQVESAVRAVNERHSRSDGSSVVAYTHANLDADELASWYRAADVLLVTPLADGMNLVAKEFVASRSDLRGALVLSEFAGVAQEFAEGAELVNPYDTQSIKQALMRTLNSPSSQRESKMSHMRSVVATNNVEHWAADFLDQLDDAANRQGIFTHRRSAASTTHRAGRSSREGRFEFR